MPGARGRFAHAHTERESVGAGVCRRSSNHPVERRRMGSLPRRGAPGICKVLPRCSPFARGAERRKAQGFARPHGPLRAALNRLAGPVRVPCEGTLAFRRSTTAIFVGPGPHTPRAAIAIRSQRATGSPAGSQLPGRSARKAGSEAPREPSRPSRTRRRRSCFLPIEVNRLTTPQQQDERTNKEHFAAVNPAANEAAAVISDAA
jgi:hypothetical protein